MGIRFFRGERTRFEHEYRQLEEIVTLLKKEFQEEPVYMLTGVLVANGEIDCVLLTRNGPLILELKAYSGEVRGLENGNWEVTAREGPLPLPNLFFSARTKRQDFIDRLIPIYKKDLPHVPENNLRKMSSWIYFSRDSTYPEGQIDLRRVKWFRVVTADTLLETMRFLDTGYTLRIQDMEAIAGGLHLQEYEFSSDRPVSPAPPARSQGFRPGKGIVALLVIMAIIAGIYLAVLLVPGAGLAVSSAVQGILILISGIVQDSERGLMRSGSSAEDSQGAIIYLNRARISGGASPLLFDERAYGLALARAEDMDRSNYLDYENPVTGSSATGLKEMYGIDANDTVLESLYGQWNGYAFGTERLAVDAWTSDAGNRERVFSNYDGAAVACSGGYCSFIGIIHAEVPKTSPLPTPVTAPGGNGTAQAS
jgi:uncharacterized protein YkwD